MFGKGHKKFIKFLCTNCQNLLIIILWPIFALFLLDGHLIEYYNKNWALETVKSNNRNVSNNNDNFIQCLLNEFCIQSLHIQRLKGTCSFYAGALYIMEGNHDEPNLFFDFKEPISAIVLSEDQKFSLAQKNYLISGNHLS